MNGLSILIPLYNHDATVLVAELRRQLTAWPGPAEVVLLDDGSAASFRQLNRPLASCSGVRYAELPRNVGRAAVRNQLVVSATYDWLLLLDNTTQLGGNDWLLARYAAALGAAPVLAGGAAYAPAPPTRPGEYLRWLYGRQREFRPVAVRQAAPYAQFLVNNILIKKELLLRFPLDERLRGYGHEDTRLGWQLAMAAVPVQHLDNPVLHASLEDAAAFLDKSRQAVHNLAYLLRAEGLGADTRLVRAAGRLRRAGLAPAARAALARLGPALRRNLLSARPSLRALDALKLLWLLQELQ